ncbi:hypothetical protein SKAU_G00270790 [Synaphobranchus kaupii]|uniref:Rho-GAP domain-containing protein n=1 Tax=Synaphobranchus kaupii TaxID=118154 RepID=A0A9Q1F080_SYNKA|nr:hypothetical protein SKAU_G00270790 [Synaphobranchus kaupii]
MKNKAAKQKCKRTGNVGAFGCDLTEHLQNSGKDVPQVLKACTEFIEKHGIVDGIYRLSGITSNIQRLRQEFSSELSPELTREIYLQDIHCVGSLCKLYFRELPNPLLTFELYKKFMDAVSIQEEHVQLEHIQNVIKELPPPHYRTLECLAKHLVHMATFSSQTNMHARNLALVWAPNLLRSKETELPTSNGDIAFLEVRVQQIVVEFILNHVEQIFNRGVWSSLPTEGLSLACEAKCATLPTSSQCASMKLMSLEEAQAQRHPAHRQRQRENSLPDTSTVALYHTVIDLPDNRMFSGKSKKWKSIFNLGRSVTDSKGKQSRSASVFVKSQKLSEKVPFRTRKSMDSLFSTEDNEREVKQPSAGNDSFMPAFKSCTMGSSGAAYSLNDEDHEFETDTLFGVTGGSPCTSRPAGESETPPLHKALPEQMKVFKGDDSNCQPTCPINGRMLYTSSTNSSSKLAFPGSLFPLESSPRHHHKALNISEPFAVSVPLRVSAVISSNSTPCRAPDRDEAASLFQKPNRDAALPQQDNIGCSRSACSDASGFNYIALGKEDLGATAKSTRSCSTLEPAEEQRECLGTVLLNSTEQVNEISGPLPTPYQPSMQPVPSSISKDPDTRSKDPDTRQRTLTTLQLCSPHESLKPLTQLENPLKRHQELEELTQDKKHVEEKAPWAIIRLDPKIIEPDITDDKTESTYKTGGLKSTTGNKEKLIGTIFSGEKNDLDLRRSPVKKPMEERPKSLDLPDKTDENTWQSITEDSEQAVSNMSGQRLFPDIFLNKRGSTATVEAKNKGSSFELEMFLTDRQAAVRRNSAPVSVSSIRTSFVTKTCQAKSVPVIAPKIQYSQIPQELQLKTSELSLEKEQETVFAGSTMGVLVPQPALTYDEMEFEKPVSNTHRRVRTCKSFETCKATPPADKPVLRRKHNSKGESSSNNSPRFDKSTIIQRQSFRTRPNRPQSLILFSPLFPFMDYPPLGDNDKLPLSLVKNNTETTVSQCALNKEPDDDVKNPDLVTAHGKLAMPKSGQRLETSMSCFYQPQRRSMIFDSKSNRQID